MTTTARRCPFCSNPPLIEEGANDRPWLIQCINDDCHAKPFMDHADTRAGAIAAWNGSAPDLIEALEEAAWHMKVMAGDIKNPLQKRMADRWVAEARTAAAKARGEA